MRASFDNWKTSQVPLDIQTVRKDFFLLRLIRSEGGAILRKKSGSIFLAGLCKRFRQLKAAPYLFRSRLPRKPLFEL